MERKKKICIIPGCKSHLEKENYVSLHIMADSESNLNGVETTEDKDIKIKKVDQTLKNGSKENEVKNNEIPKLNNKEVNSDEKNDTENLEEDSLDNKLAHSKELYTSGSRHFLLKNYQVAADELGEACELFEEIYGPESTELGMPLLLYAKSLIALSFDENKVLDVPDVEEDNDSDEESEIEKPELKPSNNKSLENNASKPNGDKKESETQVSSSSSAEKRKEEPSTSSKIESPTDTGSSSKQTDNYEIENGNDDEEEADATSLQIAWETLELAAKIFSKQGISGLPNLAEIHTELGNIQFENEIFDASREDYDKALKIYQELPVKEHRRARAEIHYKIGLTFLLQTMNREGAEAFKTACDLLSEEVEEIKKKEDLKENDKNIIKDIEETQQDIMAKIAEIEETRQQVIDEVRAALDKYKSPTKQSPEDNGPSSSTDSKEPSSSKANDISHLIKRKKPDTTSEVEGSPAKRLNTEKTG